eukprot:Rmarinus@m.27539
MAAMLEEDDFIDENSKTWLKDQFTQRRLKYGHQRSIFRLSAAEFYVDRKISRSLGGAALYEFNVFDFSDMDLQLHVYNLFEHFDLINRCKIDPNILRRFVVEVNTRYQDNPFHNFRHAVDVTNSVMFLCKGRARCMMNHLDYLAMLISGMCHDLGHPGLNNNFQVNAQTELSRLYNDQSVLENFHAAEAFRVLSMPQCNILSNLSSADVKYIRQIVIGNILQTDMANHFKLVDQFTDAYDKYKDWTIEHNVRDAISSDDDDDGDDDDGSDGNDLSLPGTPMSGSKLNQRSDSELILLKEEHKEKLSEFKPVLFQTLLHFADISNPTKDWTLARKWSELCLEEFFKQGDVEKMRDLPVSMFMDRYNTDEGQMALSFIDFVVTPLIKCLIRFDCSYQCILDQTTKNRANWEDVIQKKLTEKRNRGQLLEKDEQQKIMALRRRNTFFQQLSEEDDSSPSRDRFGRRSSTINENLFSTRSRPVSPLREESENDDDSAGDANPLIDMNSDNVMKLVVPMRSKRVHEEVKVMEIDTLASPEESFHVRRTGKNLWQKLTSVNVKYLVMDIKRAEREHDERLARERAQAWAEQQRIDDLKRSKSLGVMLAHFLESPHFSILIFLITTWALFGSDLKYLCISSSADEALSIVFLVCFFVFSFELALTCYVLPNYFGRSLFFWLDLVAAISLLPDVTFLMEALFGTSSTETALSEGVIARAGRAARAGTRAGRFLRLVRMIRLVRIFKYLHLFEQQRVKRRKSTLIASRGSAALLAQRRSSVYSQHELESDQQVQENTEVWKSIADSTITKVVVGTLLMLVVLPLLMENEVDYSRRQGVDNIMSVYQKDNITNIELYPDVSPSTSHFVEYLDEFLDYQDEIGTPCVFFEIEDYALINNRGRINILRDEEIATVTYDDNGLTAEAWFDDTESTQWEALMSLLRTLFVIVVLCVLSYLFMHDAEHLVITPVERMMEMLTEIVVNPLSSVTKAADKAFEPPEPPEKKNLGVRNGRTELDVIQTALSKIGGLLQIGFGEAGADIISANLTEEGGIDALVPGKRMYGIFGFCDIRDFTAATECLQEDVMVFVNQVAAIVHEVVHQHHGTANKNIGDAFLLVWKVAEPVEGCESMFDDGKRHQGNGAEAVSRAGSMHDLTGAEMGDVMSAVRRGGGMRAGTTAYNSGGARTRGRDMHSQVDSALQAFVEISQRIRNSPMLRNLLGNNMRLRSRYPDFETRLGFGLHVGWAIEGAIGSRMKVDASYLSPHVNLTARLEAATKQYGVDIIFSGDFHKYLSPELRSQCRLLDKATVKGSAVPIRIFGFDLKLLTVNGRSRPIGMADTLFRVVENLGMLKYRELFSQGVECYIDGDWDSAKQILIKCSEQWRDDVPPRFLLDFMARTNFVPPLNWHKKYHVLTEK